MNPLAKIENESNHGAVLSENMCKWVIWNNQIYLLLLMVTVLTMLKILGKV